MMRYGDVTFHAHSAMLQISDAKRPLALALPHLPRSVVEVDMSAMCAVRERTEVRWRAEALCQGDGGGPHGDACLGRCACDSGIWRIWR